MMGLMQDRPLLVSALLDHAEREHGAAVMTSRHSDGELVTQTYRQFGDRSRRLATALMDLGAGAGDRVCTLAWNSGRHMELYFAVSGIGAVCHTLNPRLFEAELAYIINDAQDRLIFADLDLAPLAAQVAAQTPTVEALIVLCRAEQLPDLPLRPGLRLLAYEDLIADAVPIADWPALDENSAAALCYTSGTTGRPKGVLYSQRSIVLHTYAICAADGFGLRAVDTLLPAVPMFHVMAWGFPFAAAATGFNLVYPGPRLDGAALLDLIRTQGVTVAAGVPILWLNLARELEQDGGDTGALERIVNGGAALPPALVETFRARHGVRVQHAWGMTECSPVAGVNTLKRGQAAFPSPDYDATQRAQGRPPFGISVRTTDDEGNEMPRDGLAVGHVQLRGWWVLSAYFGQADTPVTDAEGWFSTGDLGTIDADGFLTITDRSKDAVKSGGEWISTIDLENLALAHPAVLESAVVAKPCPTWGERPLLVCVLKPGAAATPEALRDHYKGKVAKWQIPDEVIFTDTLPRTGTGKLNKVEIRKRFATPAD